MRVLFLAPHPFYQERGTPIAVDLILRTLSERGDDVDVLTYHEGEPRHYSGSGKVCIYRIATPPGCHNIRPGFSVKKLIADAYMYRRAIRMARSGQYDLVHAVEESVFMARRIKALQGTPYIFDMDSSMPEQLVEKMPFLKVFMPAFRYFENGAIRNAAAVIAVCDTLAELAEKSGAARTTVLRDISLADFSAATPGASGFRRELRIEDEVCLLYIGNLETYQGIDLLVESFARLPAGVNARLIVVGGTSEHVDRYCNMAAELHVADRAHFLGPRPIGDMASLMLDADVLVSPRIKGTNTPMKIYSYMASGKAILATDLLTHTQVLDVQTAQLAPAETGAFSRAMQELVESGTKRAALGASARRVAEAQYSMSVFTRTLNALYDTMATDADVGKAQA